MHLVIRVGGIVRGICANPRLQDVTWYAERDDPRFPGALPIREERCDGLDAAVHALVRDFYSQLLADIVKGRRRGRLMEPITWELVDEGVRREGGARIPGLRWRERPRWSGMGPVR